MLIQDMLFNFIDTHTQRDIHRSCCLGEFFFLFNFFTFRAKTVETYVSNIKELRTSSTEFIFIFYFFLTFCLSRRKVFTYPILNRF